MGGSSGFASPTALDVATDGAGLVIEAVVEDLDRKRALFRALDAVAPPDAVLATNTSAVSVTAIAAATTRPERVLGLHFFNPPMRMRLVELVATDATDPAVAARAAAIVESWDRTVVRCGDSPGSRPRTTSTSRCASARATRSARSSAGMAAPAATPYDSDT